MRKIPTTEEVRDAYVYGLFERDSDLSTDDLRAEFDAWLDEVQCEGYRIGGDWA